MAHFMFNGYLKEVSGTDTGFASVVPISGSSKVGIALISSGASVTIEPDTSIATIAQCVAEDKGDVGEGPANVPCVTAFGGETRGGSIEVSFSDGEVFVKSVSVMFGAVVSRTVISAIGAVVFVSKSAIQENSVSSMTEQNAIPVCYLDFGGSPIESSSGPFKILFNGGDVTAEPEIPGTIFRYKQA